MKKKLAVILSGGGMSCCYSAGVMLALNQKYGLTNPDIVIAGSGSCGTASYFVAGQYKSIKNIWSNLLSTKKFINPLRSWRIMDIDYLIDKVFKIIDPLDANKIKESKIDFLIPVTNYETGKLEYLSAKEVDIFEAMRAAKAMPLVYNKKVTINGYKYCDTFLSSSPELHILKAYELGATDIILIKSCHKRKLTHLGSKIWLFFRSSKFKKNYYAFIKRKNNPNVNILTISPSRKISVSTFSNNKKQLAEIIELGYKDCVERDELRCLI